MGILINNSSVISSNSNLGGAITPLLYHDYLPYRTSEKGWVCASDNEWLYSSDYPELYQFLVNEYMSSIGSAAMPMAGNPTETIIHIFPNNVDNFTVTYDYGYGVVVLTRSDFIVQGNELYYSSDSVSSYYTIYLTYNGKTYTCDMEYDDTDAYFNLIDGSNVIPKGSTSITISDITLNYIDCTNAKLCLVEEESNLQSLYEKTGNAQYFLVDFENDRFKLPRLKERKVVENFFDSTSYLWYRLYSDGWVEQGGKTQDITWNANGGNQDITLPIPMQSLIYSVSGTMTSSTANWNCPGCMVSIISATEIRVRISTLNDNQGTARLHWDAKGFADTTIQYRLPKSFEYYYCK